MTSTPSWRIGGGVHHAASSSSLGGDRVGDEHVDELAGERGTDGGHLLRATGDADDLGHTLDLLERHADDALVDLGFDALARRVVVAQGDVADGALAQQVVQLGPADDGTVTHGHRVGGRSADADEGDVEVIEGLHGTLDMHVGEERFAGALVADDARHRQQGQAAIERARHDATQLGGVDLGIRLADAADDLHDLRVGEPVRGHARDHVAQGVAPAHADGAAAGDDAGDVAGGSAADGATDLALRVARLSTDDHRLLQSETALQLALDVDEEVVGLDHGDLHHARLACLRHEPGDLRPRQAEALGDGVLVEAVFVVEAGHLDQEAELVVRRLRCHQR